MQNRNLYLSIAAVFLVLLGIIFYLEAQRPSSEAINATIDARVALSNELLQSTVVAQRPLILTDVALAYPSETPSPTATATFTASPTPLDPPTQTPTPTATPLQLRGFRGIEVLEDINPTGVIALDNFTVYFAVSESNILRVYDFDAFQVLWEVETISPITHLAWSTTDNRILSAHEDGHVFLWRFNENEPLLSLELGQNLSDLIWSPDGTSFVTAVDNELNIWDLEGVLMNSIPVALQPKVVWRRLDRYPIVADSNGLSTLNLSIGSSQLISNIVLPVTLFDVAPDNINFVYVDANNIINRRTITIIQPAYRLTPNAEIISLDWSPDGESLVTTDSDNYLQVRDAATGSVSLSLQHSAPLVDARWTADNRHIFVITDFIYVFRLR